MPTSRSAWSFLKSLSNYIFPWVLLNIFSRLIILSIAAPHRRHRSVLQNCAQKCSGKQCRCYFHWPSILDLLGNISIAATISVVGTVTVFIANKGWKRSENSPNERHLSFKCFIVLQKGMTWFEIWSISRWNLHEKYPSSCKILNFMLSNSFLDLASINYFSKRWSSRYLFDEEPDRIPASSLHRHDTSGI